MEPLREDEIIRLTYPGNLILKLDLGDHTMITDYPGDRDGQNVSFNPWLVFLSAILSCQAVNLAKYCKANGLDYQDVKVELRPYSEDPKTTLHPEYNLCIELPEDFPKIHIQPMVESFMDCPVVNHLTELKPIMKTFVNDKEILEKRRK